MNSETRSSTAPMAARMVPASTLWRIGRTFAARPRTPPAGTRRAGMPSGSARAGLAGPALAQEALELAGQDVARGQVLGPQRRLLLLGGRLQALDEGLHVRVALDGQRDLALVVPGRGLQLAGVDRHAYEALELAHQREGCLGV